MAARSATQQDLRLVALRTTRSPASSSPAGTAGQGSQRMTLRARAGHGSTVEAANALFGSIDQSVQQATSAFLRSLEQVVDAGHGTTAPATAGGAAMVGRAGSPVDMEDDGTFARDYTSMADVAIGSAAQPAEDDDDFAAVAGQFGWTEDERGWVPPNEREQVSQPLERPATASAALAAQPPAPRTPTRQVIVIQSSLVGPITIMSSPAALRHGPAAQKVKKCLAPPPRFCSAASSRGPISLPHFCHLHVSPCVFSSCVSSLSVFCLATDLRADAIFLLPIFSCMYVLCLVDYTLSSCRHLDCAALCQLHCFIAWMLPATLDVQQSSFIKRTGQSPPIFASVT
ncbi:hypothetical protein BCR44DRAFT_236380 [Catenaria anguillulae PL171]|uniref:Uncharacterized protein n=1 Tax=Catenaria anguillulae PL171 TaxID=765915 RepID=A0A1Y2H9Z4_9FUNG|nr:hypothetical protein BCR44DRAFT_236380 [Catenaria anguillulae PL171]